MNVRKLILQEYQRQKTIPFAWATADCLGFVCDCARLIIGRDPALHIRGRYDSEVSAKRIMVEEGWADMADVAASLFSEIPVAMAQSGDWARITNEGDLPDVLGVVIGAQVVARGKERLAFDPLTRADRAFRVA